MFVFRNSDSSHSATPSTSKCDDVTRRTGGAVEGKHDTAGCDTRRDDVSQTNSHVVESNTNSGINSVGSLDASSPTSARPVDDRSSDVSPTSARPITDMPQHNDGSSDVETRLFSDGGGVEHETSADVTATSPCHSNKHRYMSQCLYCGLKNIRTENYSNWCVVLSHDGN